MTAAQLSRQAGNAVLFIVLARFMSPEDFGIVALSAVIVNFFILWSDLGSEPLVARTPRAQAHRMAESYVLVSLVWTTIVSAMLYLAAPSLAVSLDKAGISQPLSFMALAIPFGGISAVFRGFCSASGKFVYLASAEVLGLLSGAIIAFALVSNGYKVEALVAQFLVSNAVPAVLYLTAFITDRHATAESTVDLRWSESLSFAGFVAINYWSRNVDNLLVGKFLGTYQLGLYERAYQLMYVPASQVSGALGRVMVPMLSSTGDRRKFEQMYLLALSGIAVSATPFLVALSSLANPVADVIFGPGWDGLGPVLTGLAAAGSLQATSSSVGWLYQASGAGRSFLRNGLLFSALTIVGLAIGVSTGSVVGVASSYFITTAALTVPIFWAAVRVAALRFAIILKWLIPIWVASALQWTVTSWMQQWFEPSDLITLALYLVGSYIVFCVTLGVMNPVLIRRIIGVRRELAAEPT
ncbi:oligosaccharide flippase family protein [Actinomycetospora sp. SF1]|nr:oligosaccharide flippase family protein [Actinomycetospora soli]